MSGPAGHGDSQETATSNIGNQDQRQIQMTSHCSCPHGTDPSSSFGTFDLSQLGFGVGSSLK